MFDKNEELINVVDPEYLLENTQQQGLNGLITTVVSAPHSKELESAFYIGSRDIDDNNIFWLYKVDKRTKDNNNIILNGTYSLFDDLKAYDVIRDKRPSNTSALVGINVVLEGSRWQVGNITSTHTGTANWYYVSRLEAFWEYLENWNVEFKPRMTFSKGKITGRYIDIVDKLSDDYGKWYEYGDKLLQVTAEQASDSLYTAFIGRGKGEEVGDGYGRRIGFEKVVWSTSNGKPVNKPLNQDYIEIPSATALYGYSDGKPRTTVVIFEDIEDPTQVLEQTYEYALNECRPKLQMKANVIENGLSELGETCTIIRDDRGIRYKTRVFKLTRDFLNKNRKTVEFGDEIVISTAKRNSNTAKEIKKQEDQTIYWLDSLRQQVVDSYFNEDGYNYDLTADNEYDLPAGYYSFDRPIDSSPTKVVYMGAGKIMIANSKLPNGQWNWTTAINGDGANLSAVNTGVLQAGRIKSASGRDLWDLDNSKFSTKGINDETIELQDGKVSSFSPDRKQSAVLDSASLRFHHNQETGGQWVQISPYGTSYSNDAYKDVTLFRTNLGLGLKPGDNNSYSKNVVFGMYGVNPQIAFAITDSDLNPIRTFSLEDDNDKMISTVSNRFRVDSIGSGAGRGGMEAGPIYSNGANGTFLKIEGDEISKTGANEIFIIPSGSNGGLVVGNKSRTARYSIESGPLYSYGAGDRNGKNLRINGSQISVHNSIDSLFLTPSGGGAAVIAGNPERTIHYPMGANAFNVVSERKFKSDIKPFENALSLLSTLKVKRYEKDGKEEIGLITDEAPLQILSESQKEVSLYDFTSLTAKSTQQLSEIVYQLIETVEKQDERIKQLEAVK